MEDTFDHEEVKAERDWKGDYVNPWPAKIRPSLFHFLEYVVFKKAPPVPSQEQLDKIYPIVTPNMEAIQKGAKGEDIQVTWVGHSTFLIQMEGVTILTDPIFAKRASPVPWIGPKRYRRAAMSLHELPKIDFVLVSHNHYDHLDAGVVKKLANSCVWYVPCGMKNWFHRFGVDQVVELDWWEEQEFREQLKVVATPCNHWSKRHLFWKNDSLWNSYVVVGKDRRIFFAGDTSYCNVFKTVGRKYGPIDLSFLPIGSYCPREYQQYSHVDPHEAVKMHKDLRSKMSIGMHFGTFHLTSEPVDEPPQMLVKALKEANVPLESFFVLKHGETWLSKRKHDEGKGLLHALGKGASS